MTEIESPSSTSRTNAAISLGVVLFTLAAMLAFTWRTWCDPIIDFGRELYITWQLSQGKVLYRDIAYFNGPLSPWFNAMLFRVFGASLMTLVGANIAILIALILMLHRLGARIADELSAGVACVAFIVLLATGQPGSLGNYNYLTPYSHDLVHGVALSVGMIACLGKHRGSTAGDGVAEATPPLGVGGKFGWLAGAGLLLGLVFLNKPEVFLAAAIAGLAGVIFSVRATTRRIVQLAIFIVSAMAPPLVAIGILARHMPAQEALRSVVLAWHGAFDTRLTTLPFYQYVRGTDDLARSLGAILGVGAAIGLLLLGLMAAGWRQRARGAGIAAGLIAGAIVAVITNMIGWQELPWELGRPLVVIVPGLLVLMLKNWKRVARAGALPLPSGEDGGEGARQPERRSSTPRPLARRERGADDVDRQPEARSSKPRPLEPDARLFLQIIFATFATVLLAKIALRVQLYHYGVALAMPALLLAVIAGVGWLPAWWERRGGSGAIVRGGVIGMLAAVCIAFLSLMQANYRKNNTQVGSGADAFYADARSISIQQLLAAIDRFPERATLAVIPQGVMLNYLARRENPTPYVQLMPPEVILFGEGRIAESFAAHPPDYVIILRTDLSEYGFRSFPQYAPGVAAFIDREYDTVQSVVDAPQPWILLKRRRSAQ